MELSDMQHILDRFPQGAWKGLDIPDEWFPIIHQLDADLAGIDPNYMLHQVKEKFGDLRYYVSFSEDSSRTELMTMDALISDAEHAVQNLEETTEG